MQKSAANLDVADAAPTAPVLTGYDEQHWSPISVCSMPQPMAPTGKRSRGPC
ncbi:hypothetical protein ACVWWO_000310 [Bradyrhizobium sp. F1.13.1]